MLKVADLFILLAIAISFVVSAYLWFSGFKLEGIFTAIWIPAIFGFASYFKLLGLIAIIKERR